MDDQPSVGIGALTGVAILAVIGLVLYEAFAPPSASIYVRLRDKIAQGEETALNRTRAAEAATERQLALATAEAEALKTAYEAEAQANAAIKRELYALEAETYKTQQQALYNSQWVDRFGINIASGLCMMSGVSKTPEAYSGACAAREQMETQMLARYPDQLGRFRSDLPETRMGDVRSPRAATAEEQERLMDAWLNE